MPLSLLINKNAGTVQRKGIDVIIRETREKLGPQLSSLDFLPPQDFPACLDQLKKTGADILIGGGDGTFSHAASHLYRQGVPFGTLPLGTMNLFARDLGVSPDFSEALSQYRNYKTAHVDLGRVNDRIFICNAILGVIPAATKVREKARRFTKLVPWPDVLAATMQGLSVKKRKTVELQWGAQIQKRYANAVIVAHNCYIKDPAAPHDRLRKESMTCGQLSVYTAKPESMLATIMLLFRILTGHWVGDPSIEMFETENVEVYLENESALLTIDGEIARMKTPLHFSIEPGALPVLVPATVKEIL